MSNKIKHDYVHSNEPQPETWAEAILAGLTLIAASVVWCAVLYLLLHTGIGGA